MYESVTSLYDSKGQRKYLNHTERIRFLECSESRPLNKRIFCQVLYYTGARIAEVHNMKTSSVDFSNKTVVLETLKKRKRGIYREIPLPNLLLQSLHRYIDYLTQDAEPSQSMWSFSLRTASRFIKETMTEAKITGVRSCARGLRHGFAVHAVNYAPITVVKKWLGHSRLETTSIYLDVIGVEERRIAQQVWDGIY